MKEGSVDKTLRFDIKVTFIERFKESFDIVFEFSTYFLKFPFFIRDKIVTLTVHLSVCVCVCVKCGERERVEEVKQQHFPSGDCLK